MIQFSNGHQLTFCCGAGALGYDGRGWPWEWPFRWLGMLRPHDFTVVAKTVTMSPRKGNLNWLCPWKCVRLIKNGVVNAVGLTNPGINSWIEKYYPTIRDNGYRLAASIEPADFNQLFYMANLLGPLHLAYIEVNISCPNNDMSSLPIYDGLVTLKRIINHPVVFKLSFQQAMNAKLLKRLSEISGIEALHLINTVPWSDVYPNDISPLYKHVGKSGGVSGKDAKPFAIKAIKYATQHTKLPIIGGNGIMCYEDVLEFENAGASAFSIGSLFLRHPTLPNKIIRKYHDERKKIKAGR